MGASESLALGAPHTIARVGVGHATHAMSSFIRALSQLKVKEVPDFLQKTVTVRNVTEYAKTSFAEYRTKYIVPGSPVPIYHVMGGVFVTAYITVWPTEYRHMIAAKKGAH
jgi:hypothetical protein